MWEEPKKLNELFPNRSDFEYFFRAMFDETVASSESFDASKHADNFLRKYGNKYLLTYVSERVGELPYSEPTFLSQIIVAKYRNSWNHLWESYITEYNPIENYNMRDVVIDNTTRTRTPNLTHTNSSATSGNNESNAEAQNRVYGFNSTEALDEGSNSNSVTSTATGTTTSESTDTGTDTNEKTQEITTVRSGNIGATTTQFMLDSERQTWAWNFYDAMYKDIVNELCIPAY